MPPGPPVRHHQCPWNKRNSTQTHALRMEKKNRILGRGSGDPACLDTPEVTRETLDEDISQGPPQYDSHHNHLTRASAASRKMFPQELQTLQGQRELVATAPSYTQEPEIISRLSGALHSVGWCSNSNTSGTNTGSCSVRDRAPASPRKALANQGSPGDRCRDLVLRGAGEAPQTRHNQSTREPRSSAGTPKELEAAFTGHEQQTRAAGRK